eukprot:UN11462
MYAILHQNNEMIKCILPNSDMKIRNNNGVDAIELAKTIIAPHEILDMLGIKKGDGPPKISTNITIPVTKLNGSTSYIRINNR